MEQFDDPKYYFDKNPSEVTRIPWIYATNKKTKYPLPNRERSGKWMIFADISEIDNVWKKIKIATESGILGRSSKVATAMPNSTYQREKVICVYTYDIDDKDDVMRIRQELRNIGFERKLSYKLDSKTEAGQYRINGDQKISSYYE